MKTSKIDTFYPWVLLGGSLVGLVSSVWQAAERVQMLKHPAQSLACNLNPVIDCSGVLDNRWSSLFGFPNAFIGIAIFAMLFMASLLLISGGKPTKFFSRALLAVSTILILFSLWFFGMSLYVIGRVCIFCLFIWAVSLPVFWYGAIYYLQTTAAQSKRATKLRAFGEKHHLEVLIVAYVVLLALFFYRFRGYYFS
ncbi:MAG: vitamin K epoxide reductase family protein [Candidatus Saccharibacteria bacterium]|nr:vitamin K epoxide reductase family protein [Candidatus Saccharibacteria bacterium]